MKPSAIDLKVGGLARLSTCDWPGQLVATVFCQGCAWDCPYCHNPGLRPVQANAQIPWTAVLDFLQSRRGLLDAVVFSGGEPTLQTALFDAIQAVRSLGFRAGLHTAGIHPQCFAAVLPWLDWVGFDVKAPFAGYARITGVQGSGECARTSLRTLLASRVPYEVRTTLHPALLTAGDMLMLKEQLLALGVTHYVAQQVRSQGVRAEFSLPAQDFSFPDGFGNGFLHFAVRSSKGRGRDEPYGSLPAQISARGAAAGGSTAS